MEIAIGSDYNINNLYLREIFLYNSLILYSF